MKELKIYIFVQEKIPKKHTKIPILAICGLWDFKEASFIFKFHFFVQVFLK